MTMDMGIEYTSYIRYVAALVFVLSLIWLVGYIMRRGMWTRLGLKRPTDARIKISEILPIDSRNRLVLIRCDNQEHLILLGHERALLIQSGLEAASPTTLKPEGTQMLKQHIKKEPVL